MYNMFMNIEYENLDSGAKQTITNELVNVNIPKLKQEIHLTSVQRLRDMMHVPIDPSNPDSSVAFRNYVLTYLQIIKACEITVDTTDADKLKEFKEFIDKA